MKRDRHYHMCYELTAENIVHRSTAMRFQEGGQFEVWIHKAQFPVPAPNCKGDILLRMPWTDASLPNAAAMVEQKRTLYQRIRTLTPGSKESVAVMIDLAPYVREISQAPLKVELKFCNVFFAQHDGAYVPPEASPR